MEQNYLQKRIMRRVYTIHMLRKVVNKVTLKCAVLMVFALGVASAVSVGNVIQNMPNFFEIAEIYYFSKYALMNTELAVQGLLFGAVAITVWLMRDVVGYVLTAHEPKQSFVHQ